MHRTNFNEIYARYASKFPEVEGKLNYNYIYETEKQASVKEKVYRYYKNESSCTESSDNENQRDNTIEKQEWTEQNNLKKSQYNNEQPKIKTKYSESNITKKSNHFVHQSGKTHVTQQVSRHYSKTYYENQYDSTTSNSKTSEHSKKDKSLEDMGVKPKKKFKIVTQGGKVRQKKKVCCSSFKVKDTKNTVSQNYKFSSGDANDKIDPNVERESRLQRFDRLVTAELRRRRDSVHIMLEPVTSDSELLKAVDHLARAENVDTFSGAVQAAEEAAAKASPEEAEEAAVKGARGYQAEVIDVIEENVPGWTPIKVMGYVGITRPKLPTRS